MYYGTCSCGHVSSVKTVTTENQYVVVVFGEIV